MENEAERYKIPRFSARLANGERVNDRTDYSHVHWPKDPDEAFAFMTALPAALEQVSPQENQKIVKATIDMGLEVFSGGRIETTADDEVVYVWRKGRTDGPSRVVVNPREIPKTSNITVVLGKFGHQESAWTILTAFAGDMSAREPWDKNIRTKQELDESVDFWSRNALILDEDDIDTSKEPMSQEEYDKWLAECLTRRQQNR